MEGIEAAFRAGDADRFLLILRRYRNIKVCCGEQWKAPAFANTI